MTAKPKPAKPKPAKPRPTSAGVSAAAAAAEWVPLSRLHLWADNPRNNDASVPRVVESIKRFGFGTPAVARRANGELIAGHTRYKAAQALVASYASTKPKDRAKWHEDAVRVATRQEVPTRLLELSEREAHLLAVADNRHTELTPWSDSLSTVLSDYSLEESLIAGFTDDDLAKLAKKLLDDDDKEPGHGEGEGDSDEPDLKCPGCGYDLADVFVRERVQKVIRKTK